jgi:hypothetical protein
MVKLGGVTVELKSENPTSVALAIRTMPWSGIGMAVCEL